MHKEKGVVFMLISVSFEYESSTNVRCENCGHKQNLKRKKNIYQHLRLRFL